MYRQILNAPNYAQKCALRGEIGASSMKRRVMEGKIKLLQYTKNQGENSLLGRITTEFKNLKKAKWTINMGEYLKTTGISYSDLDIMTKDGIKLKLQRWDHKEWKEEVKSKKSLELYCQWKTDIGGNDEDYDNTPASVTLYKARTNILPLNDRNRHKPNNIDTTCPFCRTQLEDLKHFLLACPYYTEIRQQTVELQQPHTENINEILGNFLFSKENLNEKKKVLQQMWTYRDKKVKQLENIQVQ